MPLCTRVSCARLCLWAATEHFGEQSVVLRVPECLSHPGPGCVFVIMREASESVLTWTPPRSHSAAMWKSMYTCPQLAAPLLHHPERPCVDLRPARLWPSPPPRSWGWSLLLCDGRWASSAGTHGWDCGASLLQACACVSGSEVTLNCFLQGGRGLCPEGPQVSGRCRHISSDARDLS